MQNRQNAGEKEHIQFRLADYVYQCATVAAALLLVLSAIV